jgi:hypothetical protein
MLKATIEIFLLILNAVIYSFGLPSHREDRRSTLLKNHDSARIVIEREFYIPHVRLHRSLYLQYTIYSEFQDLKAYGGREMCSGTRGCEVTSKKISMKPPFFNPGLEIPRSAVGIKKIFEPSVRG